jgi:hypothetical protein
MSTFRLNPVLYAGPDSQQILRNIFDTISDMYKLVLGVEDDDPWFERRNIAGIQSCRFRLVGSYNFAFELLHNPGKRKTSIRYQSNEIFSGWVDPLFTDYCLDGADSFEVLAASPQCIYFGNMLSVCNLVRDSLLKIREEQSIKAFDFISVVALAITQSGLDCRELESLAQHWVREEADAFLALDFEDDRGEYGDEDDLETIEP